MTLARKLLWASAAVFVVLIMAAISIPNLLRSKVAADQSAAIGRARQAEAYRSVDNKAVVGGLVVSSTPMSAAMQAAPASLHQAKVDAPDRKIIRNGELALVVKDVRESAAQVVRMVTAGGGQVDNLNIAETIEGCLNGTLVVRVPSVGLENAIAQFKGIALRTEREQISARDVTHEFYDNEAHLRNLHAEEQQYLAIMKQSGKIGDTLDVAEHLSDVRDRIERQQTAMQVMSHDIEMSQVSITLTKQIDTKIAGFEWRPLQNARAATRSMLIGLGEWFDAVVAFLVGLPLVLAWMASVGAALWVLYWVCRWIWRRFRNQLPALEQPVKSGD
jgi:hypothetical protein